ELAYLDYLDQASYDSTLIATCHGAGMAPTWYGVAFKRAGIEQFFSSATGRTGLDGDALVAAMYCKSCEAVESWGLTQGDDNMGAYFCADYDIAWVDGCPELLSVMDVLQCKLHPWLDATAGDAASTISCMQLYGGWDAESNRYSTLQSCLNQHASFDAAYAFDDIVSFRTASESGSVLFFVMGVDSWSDAGTRDWKSWDVVARVKPQGGPGMSQFYSVEGIPAKAVYRVVEVDAHGRPTFSEEFVRSSRPPDHDVWLAHPTIVATGEDSDWSGPGQLSRWDGDGQHAYSREFAVPRQDGFVGRLDGQWITGGRADSSDCADIVVYTSTAYDSLLTPVWDHLLQYRHWNKVLYFTGSSELEDAREAYNDVYFANVAYNQASGTQRFPADDPGPLLLIVGDSYSGDGMDWDIVVDHILFADSYGRCIGSCHSDRDATEITGTGERIGPVHRIPANTVAEVTRACQAADDWNHQDYVDPDRRVIQIVDNVYGDVTVDYPVEMAEAAAAKFLTEGYVARPALIESDFDPGDWQSKRAAFNAQLADGAAVLWGYSLDATTRLNWTSHFVGPPDTTAHTTRQRLIAFLPVCNTVAVNYSDAFGEPLAERWQFFDPRFTQIAGVVGHLDGGWEHQHRKAEELYIDAWLEAPKKATLGWVAWRAAKMAEEQGLDWMADYLRSTGTIGAYVLARPLEDWRSSITLTDHDGLMFCPSGCGTGVDSITAVVTARDVTTGEPLQGIPPEQIRVYAVPSDVSGSFAFPCSDDSLGPYRCLMPPDSTDANGQAFVPLAKIGGYDTLGYVAVMIDDGATTQFRSTRITFKSPDYDADGDVDPVDLGGFVSDFGQGTWRSDFDWDGDVDPVDLGLFSAHYGHDCWSRRTLKIPPELVAQLGLMPADESITELPSSYSLGQSSPNPSNPVTLIGYAVPPPGGRVTIEVFDVAGRRVTTLVDVETDPGWYAATWDGTADTGEKVASGVYFYRMSAPGFADRRKLVLLK
ncbi:MAG: FlgD immunoglobulin-like domain containing protein, partial [Candidatus Eisenbacteria bacterium]